MAPSAVIESATLPVALPAKSQKQEEVSIPVQAEPALLHRSLLERPYTVFKASGSYLHLSHGRKILDACGGAAVAVLGHGNQEVIAAAVEQMQRVSYVHTLSYATDSAEDLAQCILKTQPGGFDHGLRKAFFVCSGSEANDAAMKCARQYWFEKGELQRKFFISRRMAYHGNTIGSMSVSDMKGRKVPYQAMQLPTVSFVGAADAYHHRRSDESEQDFVRRLVAELDSEIQRLGPENVISFMGETISGAALGTMAAPKGYWASIRELCDKYGILLHLDEIMCGMGRTGSYFAFEQENIQPDIVVVGKGLGGGYAPIAGMLINQKVVDGLCARTSAFNHGQTYQAHPVSCAAALAVQRIVQRDNLVSRVGLMGRRLETLLKTTFKGCEYVGEVRGRGLFWTVEFVKHKKEKTPFDRRVNFGPRVQAAAFDLGVAVYPGTGTLDGVLGDHALLAPPYTATEEELETAVKALKMAYDQVVESL